jgi:hypothetical protein
MSRTAAKRMVGRVKGSDQRTILFASDHHSLRGIVQPRALNSVASATNGMIAGRGRVLSFISTARKAAASPSA